MTPVYQSNVSTVMCIWRVDVINRSHQIYDSKQRGVFGLFGNPQMLHCCINHYDSVQATTG